MHLFKLISIAIFFSLACSRVVFTKDLPLKTMSLHEAILIALRSNPNIRDANLQRVLDRFSLALAHNTFELQYHFTSDLALHSSESSTYSLTPSLSLQTPLGTQLSLSLYHDISQLNNDYIHLNLSQPLLRGGKPEVILSSLHTAEDQEKINRLSLKESIINTIIQVTQAYLQVVSDKHALTAQKLALKESKENLKQYKIQVKIGDLAPIALIDQKSQVATQALSLSELQNQWAKDKRALFILLGLPPTTPIQVQDKLPSLKKLNTNVNINFNQALKQNLTYQKEKINQNILKRNVLVAKDAQRWALNITGEITAYPKSSLNQTTNNLAMNLTIPIDDKPRQQELLYAQIALQKSKINLNQLKNQMKVQAYDFINSLQAQAKQLILAQNQVNLNNKNYKAALLGYTSGYASAFETTRKQTDWLQSKLNLIQRKISYLNLLSKFRAFLGMTLNDWHIQINE